MLLSDYDWAENGVLELARLQLRLDESFRFATGKEKEAISWISLIESGNHRHIVQLTGLGTFVQSFQRCTQVLQV